MIYQQHSMNCRGTLLSPDTPQVMGVLNLTPDSFFDGGKYQDLDDVTQQVQKMLSEGAAIIDVGAFSSRPGAEMVDADVELRRLLPVLERLTTEFPNAIWSVDTMRAQIAQEVLQLGAHIINDISGGRFDPEIMTVCGNLKAPFVLMHMQGMPDTMQVAPMYDDVVEEVLRFFIERIRALRSSGVTDILLDPGFGFGKEIDHNYRLLDMLGVFKFLELPLIAGLSRKSMICKVLGVAPAHALNGTTALHMLALERGARILRVHDVKEATQVIALYQALQDSQRSEEGPSAL